MRIENTPISHQGMPYENEPNSFQPPDSLNFDGQLNFNKELRFNLPKDFRGAEKDVYEGVRAAMRNGLKEAL